MMSEDAVQAAAAAAAAGAPAWVMTFADLMSLLLAFFVLLFSFSEMDKAVYKALSGSLKQAFGVQRDIKAKEAPKGINIIAQEFSPGIPAPTPENEVRQSTTDDYHKFPVFSDPAEKDLEDQDKTLVETKEVEIEEPKDVPLIDEEQLIHVKIDSELIRHALVEEINNGLIDMEVRQRSIILRIREKGSFPSGSAQLIKPFKVVASKISKVFSDFQGQIVVSGHTDSIPIHTQRFRSNWELSASRAASVIHELLKNNLLKEKRFQLAAYADTEPVDINKTAKSRVKNRRVEIMLVYNETPEEEQTSDY